MFCLNIINLFYRLLKCPKRPRYNCLLVIPPLKNTYVSVIIVSFIRLSRACCHVYYFLLFFTPYTHPLPKTLHNKYYTHHNYYMNFQMHLHDSLFYFFSNNTSLSLITTCRSVPCPAYLLIAVFPQVSYQTSVIILIVLIHDLIQDKYS